MNKKVVNVVLVAMVFSCAPTSKEEYLANYKKFIDEVSANYKNYTPEEWEQTNETFSRLNYEWYNKFKDQFTLEEKMRITGYQLKYNALKATLEIGNIYDSYLKDDVDQLHAKVKYYIDNKMDDDLNKLIEEAKKISKELEEEVKRLIKEMKGEK